MNRRHFLGQTLAALVGKGAAMEAVGLDRSQLTVSTASLAGFTLEEAMLQIGKMQFGGVEIFADLGRKHSVGTFPGAIVSELTKAEQKKLRALAGKFRFVTTHLPFHDLRPVGPDAALRQKSIAMIERGMRDTAWWGGSVGTVHVAGEKDYGPVWKDLLEQYRRFGDLAAKLKIRLAIETGSPNTVKQFLDLIREIDHDHVGACIDTGHTRAYRADAQLADSELSSEHGRQRYNDLLMQKAEGLGTKLIHFHVDDVRASDWREHRTVGRGIVDWTRLLRHLAKVGYKGAFAIELEETPVLENLTETRDFFWKSLGRI